MRADENAGDGVASSELLLLEKEARMDGSGVVENAAELVEALESGVGEVLEVVTRLSELSLTALESGR